MSDVADLFAALRTIDEACGEDDRQFRWRVRQLRDTFHQQQRHVPSEIEKRDMDPQQAVMSRFRASFWLVGGQ